MRNRLDKDFHEKNYFKYVELDETLNPSNVLEVNKAKLKGNFKVKIKESLSPCQRVQAFANDYLSFYMHKNNHFLKRIDGTPNLTEAKKNASENTVEELKERYRNIDKEIEVYRKQKRDKLRNLRNGIYEAETPQLPQKIPYK